MSEFYSEIVENLKKEAEHLNKRLEKARDNQNMNDYIATLKSLRETLNLVQQYDWQLKYSEYGVDKSAELREVENKISLALENKDYQMLDEFLVEKERLSKNNGQPFTEIAVWEQNHEGQIRNHRVWVTNVPYR